MLTHAHSKIVQASPGHSSQIRHQNALTERAWKDAVQGLGNTNISIAAFKVKSRLNRSVPLFVRHEQQLCSTDQQGKSYPEIIPSPFITVICFREEGMIQSFHKSHAKKPESGLFLTGQEKIWMICAVPIGQNAAIQQLLLISVCIFAFKMSSEHTRQFVMKFWPAQFS